MKSEVQTIRNMVWIVFALLWMIIGMLARDNAVLGIGVLMFGQVWLKD